jgi:hypothetical protein
MQGLSTTDEILVIRGRPASRSFLPNMDPNPLVVLSIRLSDIPAEGDPSYQVFNYIKEYYPGDYPALFVNLTFNFESAAGLEQYAIEVKKAVKDLKK